MFHVVLLEPEIPPNTGNIARLCAAFRATLHLVEPLGFQLDDRQLLRAGMDYWNHVRWHRWPHWPAFVQHLPHDARIWLVEQGAPRPYHAARFQPGDVLAFGRESAGLPAALLEAARDRWIDIPMAHPMARSLNLSNCAAIVLAEAIRQQVVPAPGP